MHVSDKARDKKDVKCLERKQLEIFIKKLNILYFDSDESCSLDTGS